MTDEVQSRVETLEEQVRSVTAAVSECVMELLVDDGAEFLVAERLLPLGSAMLPALRELMVDPQASEGAASLAALLGLEVGDRELSVAILFDVVEAQSEFAPAAASALVKYQIPGAVNAALEVLRSTSPDEIDLVVTYLKAIRDGGGNLSESERSRLVESGAWQVTTAIADFFPA